MIVGTTENHVIPPSAACCQNLLAENRDTMANDPPDTKLPMTETHRPLM